MILKTVNECTSPRDIRKSEEKQAQDLLPSQLEPEIFGHIPTQLQWSRSGLLLHDWLMCVCECVKNNLVVDNFLSRCWTTRLFSVTSLFLRDPKFPNLKCQVVNLLISSLTYTRLHNSHLWRYPSDLDPRFCACNVQYHFSLRVHLGCDWLRLFGNGNTHCSLSFPLPKSLCLSLLLCPFHYRHLYISLH